MGCLAVAMPVSGRTSGNELECHSGCSYAMLVGIITAGDLDMTATITIQAGDGDVTYTAFSSLIDDVLSSSPQMVTSGSPMSLDSGKTTSSDIAGSGSRSGSASSASSPTWAIAVIKVLAILFVGHWRA